MSPLLLLSLFVPLQALQNNYPSSGALQRSVGNLTLEQQWAMIDKMTEEEISIAEINFFRHCHPNFDFAAVQAQTESKGFGDWLKKTASKAKSTVKSGVSSVVKSPIVQSVVKSPAGQAIGKAGSTALAGAKKGLDVAKTTASNVFEAGTNALWPYKPTGYKTSKEEALDGILDLRWASVVYNKVKTQAGWEANPNFPKRYKGKCTIEQHAGTGYLGYMIIANCHDKIWASFRGTQNQKDAEADIKSAVLSTFAGVRALAGKGFIEHYAGIEKNMGGTGSLVKRIKALADGTDKQIVITGHSLGGALANLCALRLYDSGYHNFRLATFGAPRVWSKDHSSRLHGYCEAKHHCVRWVNWGDFITTLPWSITGFRHVGSPRYIYYGRPTGSPLDSLTNKPKKWSLLEYDQDMSAPPMNPLNHKTSSYLERMQKAVVALFNVADPDL